MKRTPVCVRLWWSEKARGSDEPGSDEPGSDEPGTEEPVGEEPVGEEPIGEEPAPPTDDPAPDDPHDEPPPAEDPLPGDDGPGDGNEPVDNLPELARRVAIQDTVLGNTERPDSNVGAADRLSVFATETGRRTSVLQFETSDLTLESGQTAWLELHQLDGDWDNIPVEVSVFAVTQAWEQGHGDNPWATADGAHILVHGTGAGMADARRRLQSDHRFWQRRRRCGGHRRAGWILGRRRRGAF